jgi:hypothetical protein
MGRVKIESSSGAPWQIATFSPSNNLIIAGDLNFILTSEEHWGGSFVPGHTEDYYKNLFLPRN